MTARFTVRAALLGASLAWPLAGQAQQGQTLASGGDADWHRTVAAALGKPGSDMPGGIYRVAMPRTDLKVTLDGVPIRPGFALGSWVASSRTARS